VVDPVFWQGRSVLVTGHTGFKGAWLSTWLTMLGARVSGFALAPDTDPNAHSLLHTPLAHERIGDIADRRLVQDFVETVQPDTVFHMAAQPIVRLSYRAPLETYQTNVMGTANLLEALRGQTHTEAIVVITTDKVYRNAELGVPFREDDPLGGHDPYSASKACTEILTQSYRQSFFAADGAARIATARSGNVVGGGDWSPDRIMTDIVSAHHKEEVIRLRNPGAVRPWLHVLEALSGYLLLAQALIDRADFPAASLNFAPDPGHIKTVAQVVETYGDLAGGRPGWERDGGDNPPEATHLALSAAAAHRHLGWHPHLDFEQTIRWTFEWYEAHKSGQDMAAFTRRQIQNYQDIEVAV